MDELDEKIDQLQAEMREYEAEQKVEEEKRVHIIHDLKHQVFLEYLNICCCCDIQECLNYFTICGCASAVSVILLLSPLTD